MHGLTYNQSFLDSLPLVDELSPSNGSNPNPNLHSLFPKPHSPIHSLSAAQFASLHHQHILSHPPDSVLFPFLHGIEGDNEAQNMFFATQGQSVGVGSGAVGSGTVALPEYRGMMWVICEDDLDGAEKEFLKGLSRRRSESSLYSEEEEDESGSGCSDYDSEGEYEGERGGEDLDDEEEEDLDLDLDDGDGTSSDSEEPVSPVSLAPTTPQLMNGHAAYVGQVDMDMDDAGIVGVGPGVLDEFGVGVGIGEEKEKHPTHMHPVQHRPLPSLIQTDFEDR